MTSPGSTLVAAATLTEQYRQAQVQLSARTMAQAIAAWQILARDPVENQPTWLRFMLQLVDRDRRQSARYANDYLGAYRKMLLPDAPPFVPAPLPPMNVEQVVTSLQVTGPVALQRKLREIDEQRAPEARRPPDEDEEEPPAPRRREEPRILPASNLGRMLAETSARAAQRHVVNASREVIDDAIENDVEARGYVRVTDGNPCFFCAVLASRGAVYKDDSFEESDPRFSGPGNQKVHDGCGCTLIPLYTPRSSDQANPLLERTREFEQLWYQTGGNGQFSGRRAMLEFRRAYESRVDYRV